MTEIIGWLLLGAGPAFLLGLWIGERWQKDEPDEHEMLPGDIARKK